MASPSTPTRTGDTKVFNQFVRFTNDAGALEKILRLLQALAQILAAWALTSEDVTFWLEMRRHFATGRRYFRFFKFLDCFSKAYQFHDSGAGIMGQLQGMKWDFMGGYLLIESGTILDQMGVWPMEGARSWMVTGNSLWFFALICSIIWGVLLLFGWSEVDENRRDEKNPKKRAKNAEEDGENRLRGVKRRLVSDGFDLFVPGSVTGWIPTPPAFVGFATIISTVLSSKDIWDRLQ